MRVHQRTFEHTLSEGNGRQTWKWLGRDRSGRPRVGKKSGDLQKMNTSESVQALDGG